MTFAAYRPGINPAHYEPDAWSDRFRSTYAEAATRWPAEADTHDRTARPIKSESAPPTRAGSTFNDNEVGGGSTASRQSGAREEQIVWNQAPSTDRQRKRPKHIKRVVDAKGVERTYYSRGGTPYVRLTGAPGSPEFRASYDAARRVKTLLWREAQKPLEPTRSLNRLVDRYFASDAYQRLAPQTQRVYRRVIERLIRDENIGRCDVAELSLVRVKRMHGKRGATPSAANDMLKKLRILMYFAIARGWRADDATRHVKPFPSARHRNWTSAEMVAVMARWPCGTTARTAFALLHYTGRRSAAVARMTWRDLELTAIADGLADTLSAIPRRDGTILVTSRGISFSAHGFVNFMACAIADANLPRGCTADGLRRTRPDASAVSAALIQEQQGASVAPSTNTERRQCGVHR